MRRIIFLLSLVAVMCMGNSLNGYASHEASVGSYDSQDPEFLKPKIEYVTVDSIRHDDSGFTYNVYYTIKWRGDNWLSVGVGQYFGYEPTIVVKMIRSNYSDYEVIEDGIPYYVVSQSSDAIVSDCYAFIDFAVENKWGKDEYEIVLDPGGILASNEMIEDDLEGMGGEGQDVFQVFDWSGRLIGQYSSREDVLLDAPKGLLIVRHMRGNTVVSAEKLLNK